MAACESALVREARADGLKLEGLEARGVAALQQLGRVPHKHQRDALGAQERGRTTYTFYSSHKYILFC